MRHGADPNLNADGETALIEAASHDEPKIVAYLLTKGAKPNLAPGSLQRTALYSAATKHTFDQDYAANLEVIRLLLRNGADKSLPAYNGQDTAMNTLLTQRANAIKGNDPNDTEEIKNRRKASLKHKDTVIQLLRDS